MSNSARVIAVAACTLALLGAVGCSSTPNGTEGAAKTRQSQVPGVSGGDSATPNMSAQLAGSGCGHYTQVFPDGPGSVQGMAADPVATAASNNPLLKTLVAAVSGALNPKVDIVDRLNGAEYTVLAPVDSAFAKLPKVAITSLAKPANAKALRAILTYHMIPGQIAPDRIAGTQTTIEGETVEVQGTGNNITANGARVICGGFQTENATVYLIDTVLTPPSMR